MTEIDSRVVAGDRPGYDQLVERSEVKSVEPRSRHDDQGNY
jgi:hypothetical protein